MERNSKKFHYSDIWEVDEAGWTIKFMTADEYKGGDGKYFYLWIENKSTGDTSKLGRSECAVHQSWSATFDIF